MTDNISVLDQFKPKQKQQAEVEQPDAPVSERDYKAYRVGSLKNRVSLLWIDYDGQTFELLEKGHLIKVLCTSHEFLSLIFTHSVYTFEGRHLNKLRLLLQAEKIRSLHCFDPKRHDEPAKGEPVILAIEEQSIGDFQARR